MTERRLKVYSHFYQIFVTSGVVVCLICFGCNIKGVRCASSINNKVGVLVTEQVSRRKTTGTIQTLNGV